MTDIKMNLFIVFLRFGPNRAQASQWMPGHKQWIQEGVADGTFLLAGSLDNAQGGVVVAAGRDHNALRARVAQDPFVIHGVVSAEIHVVAPSLMSKDLASLMRRSQTGQDVL